MKLKSIFKIIILLNFVNFIISNPCDITNGYKKSNRIQFQQDTLAGTQLFTLPFIGNKLQIKEITIKSSEINSSIINNYFKLDFKTLILNKTYDLDNIRIDFIELLFTCTSQYVQYSNTFLLYVTINDVNSYAPEFIGLPYKFEVKELTPIGTVITKRIRAIDKDLPNRPNSQISYSIMNGPCSEYFEFPLSTHSELAVAKLIHHETLTTCQLTIRADDHGMPPKFALTNVDILIIDVDNKDPAFHKSLYIGFINHNAVPGTYIDMKNDELKASDMDLGINAVLTYSLNSNPDDLFNVNETNGKIYLKKALPKSYKTEYNLIVKATQIDNQARSALTMLNINILNVNENGPKFDKNLYEANIKENVPYYSIVTRVHATDVDNNQIEYFMITNHDNPFIIESDTGIIKVNRKLDYETQSSYTIEVAAKDGLYTAKTFVRIDILNHIDTPPLFDQVYYNFKLKSPNEIFIGQVKAIDIENTNTLQYNLGFLNQSNSALFCISSMGVLYVCPTQESLNPQDDIKFDKSEYEFSIYAQIIDNNTKLALKSKVECRVQIDYLNSHLSTSINLLANLNSEMLFFKDTNTFYAFLAALCSVTFVLFVSIVIMIWYKCQRSQHKVPPMFTNSSASNSSNSSTTTTSSHTKNKRNSLASSKKSDSNYNYPIVNFWDNENFIHNQSTNKNGVLNMSYGPSTPNDTQSHIDTSQQEEIEIIVKDDIISLAESNKDGKMISLIGDLNSNLTKNSVKQLYNLNDSLNSSGFSNSNSSHKKRSMQQIRASSISTTIPTSSPTTSSCRRNTCLNSSNLSTSPSMGQSYSVDNTTALQLPLKEPLSLNYEISIQNQIDADDSGPKLYKNELFITSLKRKTANTQCIEEENGYDSNCTLEDASLSIDLNQQVKTNNMHDDTENDHEFNDLPPPPPPYYEFQFNLHEKFKNLSTFKNLKNLHDLHACRKKSEFFLNINNLA